MYGASGGTSRKEMKLKLQYAEDYVGGTKDILLARSRSTSDLC